MFGWIFKNRKKVASVTPNMAMSELAMRASIAGKLRNYNADEDTTISEFTLANDEKGTKTAVKKTSTTAYDVWGQANPRETGKWYKEVRRKNGRLQVIKHPAHHR
jgi:hypothetical protein